MRKLVLIFAMATLSCFANAQSAAPAPNMMSKNGTPILPESGDWSIGFNAAPWLSYVGNMLSSAGTNSVSMAYQMPQTIVGKMMKTDSRAMIGVVRIGFNSGSFTTPVPDMSSSTAGATVNNVRSGATTNIVLGAGEQWYRGKGRLKGYYGATVMLAISSNDSSYTYGNALSSTNPGSRVTSWNRGGGFGLGIRGFVGAEYFFAPKMSLSAEYGWGIGLNSMGAGSMGTDTWDGASSSVKSTTVNTSSSSNFNIDVDNWGGAIMLSLYF